MNWIDFRLYGSFLGLKSLSRCEAIQDTEILRYSGLALYPIAAQVAVMTERYETFKDFYPFYLNEHRDGTCRALHFAGSSLVLTLVVAALATANWKLFLFTPLAGYGFAWVGHFFFEKNRPATFKYPFYSLLADWVMMKDILI